MAVAILVSEKIFNFSELVRLDLILAWAEGFPVTQEQSKVLLALRFDGDFQ